MTTLTRTQLSAYNDLHRFGSLRPPLPEQRAERGTSWGFSRRTLQALVNAGYAEWRGGFGTSSPYITATDKQLVDVAAFRCGYFDEAVKDLGAVLDKAERGLKNVDFDTIVGTGFSGAFVIPALALRLGVNFVLIRKEADDSHHGGGRLVGTLGKRWIFVDDFVSSGQTRDRVLAKVREGAAIHGHRTTYVGQYTYVSMLDSNFIPSEETS